MLVDICVNLDSGMFKKDRKSVVEKALSSGVSHMVLTGTSLKSSRNVLEYTALAPGKLFFTAGFHPHKASECTDDSIEDILALGASPRLVAIGECGLDYNRDFSPRSKQRSAFEAQLELAYEMGLPVFLHERDAHEDFSQILEKWRPDLVGAVVHCFTGNREQLDRYLGLGCHIGITGWLCDERRGLGLREVVKHIPADRLMVETDAPWLTPRDLPKTRRNVPANLPHIAKHLASCVGKPYEQVCAETTAVASTFFGLDLT